MNAVQIHEYDNTNTQYCQGMGKNDLKIFL